MEINWKVVGWIIDMILNGIIWLIIAAFLLPLIDVTDQWTRKAVKFMGKADDWIRKFAENSFCLLYTSPSPRDVLRSRMPSSA